LEESSKTPVHLFNQHFKDKYKLSTENQGMPVLDDKQEFANEEMEENEDNEDEDLQIVEEEDEVAASNPEFKDWISSLKANTSGLKVLLKLTEFIDNSNEE
jgi:hypothetical protein